MMTCDDDGLYDEGPVVCMTHLRFIPCRRDDESCCVLSRAEGDIVIVTAFQQG